MRTLPNHLAVGVVFVGVVFAYPLLAGLLSIAGVPESSTPSIVLRVAVALVALFALFLGRDRLREVDIVMVLPFALFWAMYLGRIIADGYFLQVQMQIPAQTLLVYAIVFSIVPASVGFLGLDEKGSATAFRLLVAFGLVTLAVVAFDSRTVLVELQESGTTRYALDKLDPIAVANVGSSIALLGFVGVFSVRGTALGKRALFAVMMALGIVVLVFGASRGPIVATIGALGLFALLTISPRRVFMLVIMLAAVAFIGYQAYLYGEQNFAFDVLERIRRASEGLDASANNRQEQWANAWDQFINSPLYGDAISERSTGYYPHNSVLEALMATGLPGGFAYLFLLGTSLLAAMRLLLRRDGNEWLCLLGVQYMIASQFSGAHYINGAHWLTMIAVIATEARLRRRRRSRRSSSRRGSSGSRRSSRSRVPA